jgi:hypothetical protein
MRLGEIGVHRKAESAIHRLFADSLLKLRAHARDQLSAIRGVYRAV